MDKIYDSFSFDDLYSRYLESKIRNPEFVKSLCTSYLELLDICQKMDFRINKLEKSIHKQETILKEYEESKIENNQKIINLIEQLQNN